MEPKTVKATREVAGRLRRACHAAIAVVAAALALVAAAPRAAQARTVYDTSGVRYVSAKNAHFSDAVALFTTGDGKTGFCLDKGKHGPGYQGPGLPFNYGTVVAYTYESDADLGLAYIMKHAGPGGDWWTWLSPRYSTREAAREYLCQETVWTYLGQQSASDADLEGDTGGDEAQLVNDLLAAARAYAASGDAEGLAGSVQVWAPNDPTGKATQRMLMFADTREVPDKGTLRLHKTSAAPSCTDSNPNYSLAGAVYEVYDSADAADQRLVATLTTGSDGWTEEVSLDEGDYYVVEKSASAGYRGASAADHTACEGTLAASDGRLYHTGHVYAGSKTDFNCRETPKNDPFLIAVQKVDADGRASDDLGETTLEGAEFTYSYYAVDASSVQGAEDLEGKVPTRTWVCKTVKSAGGYFVCAIDDAYKVSGDDFYRDAEGNVVVPLGVVSVHETKAPHGFVKADGTLVAKIVDEGKVETVGGWGDFVGNPVDGAQGGSIIERPAKGSVEGTKADADAGTAQGDATLEGAEIGVFDAAGRQVASAKTDAEGKWSVSGLYVGSYTARETKAPEGYLLNETWSQTFRIDSDGQVVSLTADKALLDEVVSGGATGSKVDGDTLAGTPQGDAKLAGAEVSITNKSVAAVVVGGKSYAPGEVCAVAVTTEDGSWSVDGLPYGTYEARETKAPEGYLVNEEWSQGFVVRQQGSKADLEGDARITDEVARASISGTKVDAGRDEAAPQGRATLAGAEIAIKNASAAAVFYKGRLVEPGQDVAVAVTAEDGSWSVDGLPYGTYELREKAASKGYTLNEGWTRTVEVREDGAGYALRDHGKHLDEKVVRGDVNFNKIAADTQAEMAGIPFLVASQTTGEAHVVVTDENGQVNTSSSFNKHTSKTNASDAAVVEGKVVDEGKLDPAAGVWFSGNKDLSTPVDDALGALPYDAYTVSELRCSRNQGHKLIEFGVVVSRNGYEVDAGTKEDTEVSIGTSLTYAGGKAVPARVGATVTDEVSFENVSHGTHRLRGELHVVDEEGNDTGIAATAESVFKTDVSFGTTSLAFSVDTSALAGKRLVAFEYLDEGTPGEAFHADIADEGQTVMVPAIGTEASGSVGNECDASSQTIEIRDSVSYRNLEAGKTYTIEGSLHKRGTDGEDVGAVKDAQGREVVAQATFTPEAADGQATVTFSFTNPGDLAGTDIVCFESLTRGGETFAEHADIDDGGQTIHFPAVGTSARTEQTGDQDALAEGTVEIVDTVSLKNLTVGSEYTLTGELHLKGETGDEGVVSRAEKTFVAETSEEQVEVSFALEADELAGKTAVAFEALDRDGVRLGSHADIDDEGQSVFFPQIRTTAAFENGTDIAQAGGEHTVLDEVDLKNLLPGCEYRLEAEAHRISPDGSDEGVVGTGSLDFTATGGDLSETVEVIIEDGPVSEGDRVVIFERLSRGENIVARHRDAGDEGQTVHFAQIGTEATDKADGDHEVSGNGSQTVVDKVSYKGLVPGREYKVSGELHLVGEDGADTGAATDSEGSPIAAEAVFTPEEADGEASLEFTFDAEGFAGKKLVAFETLSAGGVDFASHADITDKGQTVCVVSIRTVAKDKADGDKSIAAKPDQKVTDTVSYAGLTPGTEYKLRGELHLVGDNGGDEGAIEGTAGETTFTPEAGVGEAEVELPIDASTLAGKKVVAFEELVRENVVETSHEAIADEAQTVTVESKETSDAFPQTGASPLGTIMLATGSCVAAAAIGALIARKRSRK